MIRDTFQLSCVAHPAWHNTLCMRELLLLPCPVALNLGKYHHWLPFVSILLFREVHQNVFKCQMVMCPYAASTAANQGSIAVSKPALFEISPPMSTGSVLPTGSERALHTFDNMGGSLKLHGGSCLLSRRTQVSFEIREMLPATLLLQESLTCFYAFQTEPGFLLDLWTQEYKPQATVVQCCYFFLIFQKQIKCFHKKNITFGISHQESIPKYLSQAYIVLVLINICFQCIPLLLELFTFCSW